VAAHQTRSDSSRCRRFPAPVPLRTSSTSRSAPSHRRPDRPRRAVATTGVCPGAQQTHTGTSGKDEITGTALNDLILGLAGHDSLNGANGDDCVRGNAGDDKVTGGGGSDLVHGGTGTDVHQGGSGNDKLRSADGVRDVVNCGPGDDHASVDALDQVKDCEKVTVASS
jgi:Ca2+-binding RTX toxin-like protein